MAEVKKQVSSEGVVSAAPVDTRVYTCSGKPLQKAYKRVYSEEKRRFVTVENGDVNITEYIQKSNNLTDMAMLRKRFELTGELPTDGGYDSTDKDLTYLPSNIHELYAIKKDLQAKFATLDPELQKAFGGADNFVSAFMDGSANAEIEKYYSAKAQAAKLAELEKAKAEGGQQ